MTVGETEVPILKQIVLSVSGSTVANLGETEVELLKQYLLALLLLAP